MLAELRTQLWRFDFPQELLRLGIRHVDLGFYVCKKIPFCALRDNPVDPIHLKILAKQLLFPAYDDGLPYLCSHCRGGIIVHIDS